MAKLKTELKAILDKYGIDYQDKDKLWDCHGTLVLYHKAYEIIAAQENIAFDPPTIIEGSSADKTVAMLVTGRMGERSEWSVGEAAPGNNKNSYPYAMAEKRAKDRVIAKLVGLSAYVYSEDEADDFKSGARAPVTNGGGPSPKETGSSPTVSPPPTPKGSDKDAWQRWATELIAGARSQPNRDALIDYQSKAHDGMETAKTKSKQLHSWIVDQMTSAAKQYGEIDSQTA